ncbi:PQQ-dependent sugar dehydrogenase [Paracraurococcus ruber]|uniref:Sorbosone dehydrogenase n=1 Tax=Paracraurococcus ruber TaxID=77675 RepID=A0ABS1D7V6_9PROT|nr:PQQ-dependent sugar dehydrogenase [Paracraurococcus ruber]MBK1662347.1 sorbosone dehydrogenase [Paracraurococcus ruber]TDG20292.1 sorbosone dehydrogenase family protein [Paracraurococcus ruber]
MPTPQRPGLLATAAIAAGLLFTAAPAMAQLKSYDSSRPSFWQNPPPDWFLGDETEEQKGLAPPVGPATPTPLAELQENLKKIKLPPGFRIEVWAHGIPEARQMAWGDNGTLFVGSFGATNVYAVTERNGQRSVATILKGLNMPTGVAFRDGALYVAAINKILRYDNAERSLENMPQPVTLYDDLPPYVAHGWKYLVMDREGAMYFNVGVPFNIGIPPAGTAHIRRVHTNGLGEQVAMGVRNSVGGDIDPRTGQFWFTENARDWLSNDLPSDKLNRLERIGTHFGYPYCHQGDLPDPKFNAGQNCANFTPPVLNLGAHVAPLGMKFYTGSMFPAEYRNNVLIAEHGSWNRRVYQGGRIMRVQVDADGKNARQEVFAEGWLTGAQEYSGRPNDIIVARDGSILVADDWAGAIYRISYSR